MRAKHLLALLALTLLASGPLIALPKLACAGMSALLPGSGQLALGKDLTGGVMLGVDVLALSAWLATERQKDDLIRSYQRYATVYAHAPEDMDDRYYQHLQQYLSSDEFNQFQEMMARNYYLIYIYDPDGYSGYILANTYGSGEEWQWQSEEHQDHYRSLRRRTQSTKMYQNLSLGVLILNRAISVIDVALTKRDPASGSALYFSSIANQGLMLNYRLEF